jgi:hypothetical protein
MRAELRSGLVFWVFLAAAFSGCAQAKAAHVDPDPYAQPEGFDDNTGSVVGTVVDEEFVPLKDAIVGFIDPYQAAKTDEAGHFEIGLLNAGSRNLYVIHLGHQSQGKKIEIKVRQSTEVLFVLKVLPVEVPWVHVVPKKGYFGQSLNIEPLSNTRVNASSHQWVIGDKTAALESMILEAKWSAASSLSGGIEVTFGLGGNAAKDTFFTIRGQSPLVGRVDRADIEKTWQRSATVCVSQPCLLRWEAHPAPGVTNLPLDVGVMMDQSFEVYVSHFYRMPPPDGYTLI